MNGPRDIDPPAAPSASSRKSGEIHPPSKDILRALKENQDGDARLFVQLHEDRYAYDHSEQEWYRFDGSHWKKDTTGLATAAITDVIDAYAAEAGIQHRLRLAAEKQGNEEEAKRRKAIGEGLHERIYKLQGLMRKKQVLALAAVDWAPRGKSLALEGTEWDADPMLLGCKNGVIDLRNGTFRAGKPGDYIKTYSPTEWRGLDAPAPGWERFLLEVFDHDKDMVDYIQRLSGYAITGQTSEHIYPILCGPGRNGKGTFLEVQKEVLGNLAGTIDAETILSQPWGKQAGAPSSEIMYMRGKRLLWSSETDEGRSFATGKLKWLTGGDTLTARPVYGKEQIDFRPSHTLFLITNHRPHASSEDRALWERVHLIDFKWSFVDNPKKPEDRQRDAKLPKKVKKEKAGILAWMVRGCLLWQQHGLKPPDSIKAATENYRKEEDLLGHFLAECCVLGENTEVQAGKLYHAYEDWCGHNKHKAITGTAFGLQMKKRFDACKGAHGIMYRGCGLLDQIHEGL
jgi:putative DNA primase/helicase